MACGHGGIVKGVNKGQLLLLGQGVGVQARSFQGIAMQHHFSAKAARALNLYAGGKAGHHDHGTQPHALRVVGHPLGVVARAHGHHAPGFFFGGEQLQAVARAALFERGGKLQVFKL